MRSRQRAAPELAAFLAALVMPLPVHGQAPARPTAKPDGLVLVVSESTNLVDITQEDLRRVFQAEAVRDDSGRRLLPLNHPAGTPARSLFDQRVMAMSPDTMARYWIDQKIRGQKGAPRSVAPARDLARLVAKFPGTITYLAVADLVPGLKLVSIDGRGAREPAYLLREARKP
jgi:hypothetical protein